MRRWIWFLALGGCANTNIGEWEGETFDCVDPTMNQRAFVANLFVEPMNGVASSEFDLDEELLTVGGDCNLLRGVGLGLRAGDPVMGVKLWRCEVGVLELRLDSTGSGQQRLATLHTQTRRGSDRDPEEYLCSANLYRR